MLVKRYELPDTRKQHALGDLAIASNGDVYATDSLSPAIYVVRRFGDKLEEFLTSDAFTSPQGLDITPDGKYILMADYAKGLFRIDFKTKEIIRIAVTPNLTAQGIDGLYFYRNSLIATQNGVNAQRVIRVFLERDYGKAKGFEVLEANNPLFDDITLGCLTGNRFYFIANSQWGELGPNGKFANPEKLVDASILTIRLER